MSRLKCIKPGECRREKDCMGDNVFGGLSNDKAATAAKTSFKKKISCFYIFIFLITRLF